MALHHRQHWAESVRCKVMRTAQSRLSLLCLMQLLLSCRSSILQYFDPGNGEVANFSGFRYACTGHYPSPRLRALAKVLRDLHENIWKDAR